MPRKAQFFDRTGRPISEAAAHDTRGVIRDGVITRVPLTMADAAASRFHFPRQRQQFADGRQLFDSGQVCCTDGDGTLRTANAPGWRISDSPINRQAVHDARARYLSDLETAWRQDAAVEEEDDGGDRTECPNCSGSGYDENGKACPRCGGSGEIDDVDEEAESQSDAKRRRRPEPDDDDDDVPFGSQDGRRRRTVDEMQVRRERILKPIYDSWVTELANAWRGDK